MAPKFAQTAIANALPALTDNTETTLYTGAVAAGTKIDWIRVYTPTGETATHLLVGMRDGVTGDLGYVHVVPISDGELQIARFADLVLPDGWLLRVQALGTVDTAVFVCCGGAELG